jgi:rhodanese-related sulfurtransferase
LKGSLRESPEEFTLVDVRTALEYELFHIHGSKNQPNLLLHPELFKAHDPKKPLVIICMTGHRSSVVAYRLKKREFTEVNNLTFGMLGWLLSGGETHRQKEKSKKRTY